MCNQLCKEIALAHRLDKRPVAQRATTGASDGTPTEERLCNSLIRSSVGNGHGISAIARIAPASARYPARMKFETEAIHIGQEPDTETGAVMPPIYATSTFAQERPGVNRGYDYTRSGNPNFTRLGRTLAALEGG